MSLKYIEQRIKDFLSSDDNDVLVIKGDWGTGKTFLWNKLVNESSKKGQVSRKKYCYISLFGISDLQHLKNNIFDETIDTSLIEQGVSLVTLRRNVAEVFGRKGIVEKLKAFFNSINIFTGISDKGFLKWLSDCYKNIKGISKRQTTHIEKLPLVKDYSSFFRSAAYHLIRDTLICLDDL